MSTNVSAGASVAASVDVFSRFMLRSNILEGQPLAAHVIAWLSIRKELILAVKQL